MNQFYNQTYWLNLVTGEIFARIPRDLDIYQQAAWFERVDENGNKLEDI